MEINISIVSTMVQGITSAKDLPFIEKNEEEEWPLTLAIFPYGQAWHAGQTRRNGRPYFEHCIEIMFYLWARGVITDRRAALAIVHDSIEEGLKDPTKDVNRIREEAQFIFSEEPDLIHLMEILNNSDIDEEYKHPDALISRIGDTALNVSDYAHTGSLESMKRYLNGKVKKRVRAFVQAFKDPEYAMYRAYIYGSLLSIERNIRLSQRLIDQGYRTRKTLESLQKKGDIIKKIPEPLRDIIEGN